MSAEGALGAVTLQRDKVRRLSTTIDGYRSPGVTPAIACLVRTALEDLDDAVKQLELQVRRQRTARA